MTHKNSVHFTMKRINYMLELVDIIPMSDFIFSTWCNSYIWEGSKFTYQVSLSMKLKTGWLGKPLNWLQVVNLYPPKLCKINHSPQFSSGRKISLSTWSFESQLLPQIMLFFKGDPSVLRNVRTSNGFGFCPPFLVITHKLSIICR